MDIVRTFFELLTTHERRKLYLLFCAVLVMAGLEVVSVASIMPFLSVAADPASVHENVYLNWAFNTFGFADTNTFLATLGLGALSALLVSNSFIVFTIWALRRYAWNRNHTLSRRLLQSYLHQPYEYFLSRNSAELGKNILEEVKEVVAQMLVPGLRGVAKSIAAIFIIVFLVFVDPVVALIISCVLGVAYTVIYYIVKSRLDTYGEGRVNANTKRYQVVSEAFGGIKQVKLRGKEDAFLEQYNNPSRWYSKYQAKSRVIKKAPRYILEVISFGGIISIAIYLIFMRGDIQQVIPMLGLYAFAGYRLLPALQSGFRGIASARFNLAALEELHQGLMEAPPLKEGRSNKDGTRDQVNSTSVMTERIAVHDLYFTYPGANEPTIRDLSLEIPAYSTVGFVGRTGSGKTTMVDLLLGLLRPQRGSITVDGTPLRDGVLRQWQRDIGYVPQDIYLSDDTVARNIAFGVPEGEIDMDAVRDAARRAHIRDFVEGELPSQWDTFVGERGVKLSGGQRQRVGIARALYHRPSVLVFDEATSALDQATESNVMEAIYDLDGDHTILIIAHRLSTVKRADNIVMLENGEKIGEGSYEKLQLGNKKFRSMALS